MDNNPWQILKLLLKIVKVFRGISYYRKRTYYFTNKFEN